MNSLVSIVSSLYFQVGAGIGIFAGVYKFFKTIDENLNKETSSAIAAWLLSPSSEQPSRWPDMFGTVFGKIFGEKQLSWKCIGISVLITTASLFAIAPFIVLSRGTAINRSYILTVIPIQILGALGPGYLCILLTRMGIRILQRVRRVVLAVIIVILATYVNYLLSASSMFIADFLYNHLVHRYYGPEPFAGLKESIDTGIGTFCASMFASLASSIWMWLCLVSSLILKALVHIRKGFIGFSKTLNIKEKPIACVGLVSGAACAIIWWGYLLVHLAFDKWVR